MKDADWTWKTTLSCLLIFRLSCWFILYGWKILMFPEIWETFIGLSVKNWRFSRLQIALRAMPYSSIYMSLSCPDEYVSKSWAWNFIFGLLVGLHLQNGLSLSLRQKKKVLHVGVLPLVRKATLFKNSIGTKDDVATIIEQMNMQQIHTHCYCWLNFWQSV